MDDIMATDDLPKLVCIDDDPLIRKSFTAYLEDCGYKTFEAADGKIGIDLVRKEKPDIILLDLRMPEVDGLDALEVLRKDFPQTPVIIISGTGEIKDAILALRRGAWDFITKPITDLRVLNHAISMARERSLLILENQRYREHLETLVQERTEDLRKRSLDLEIANARIKQEMAERAEAEKERLQLFAAFEHAVEGIAVIDKDDGTIRYVNPAFAKITGLSENELRGRPYKMLTMNESDPKSFFVNIWQTINAGGIWSGSMVGARKDGSPSEVEISVSPIRDADNKIVGFVSLNRDITQERQLERQLIRAQKMESIGTLAGGIAHDFNNILSAILGYTQLAIKEISENVTARTHCEKVLLAGSRARDLVSQILRISRSGEQEKGRVPVRSIVKEVLKLLRATLPPIIRIEEDLAVDHDIVEADPTHIHQAIMNLCTNAAHAMESEGGTLGIGLSGISLDASGGLEPGEYLKIVISDTGNGIPEECRDKIFEPYFTTKALEKGTGLGLAVTRSIIDHLSGCIDFETEVDAGTTFTVLLPLAEKREEVAPRVISEELPVGTERILFVDDEEPLVDIGREILEQLGYTVVAKNSSKAALEAFRKAPEDIDLVIADLFMPDMTGLELAKEIRLIRKDIPMLLCTGIPSLVTEEMIKSAGFSDMMIKPFLVSELAERIREILNHR